MHLHELEAGKDRNIWKLCMLDMSAMAHQEHLISGRKVDQSLWFRECLFEPHPHPYQSANHFLAQVLSRLLCFLFCRNHRCSTWCWLRLSTKCCREGNNLQHWLEWSPCWWRDSRPQMKGFRPKHFCWGLFIPETAHSMQKPRHVWLRSHNNVETSSKSFNLWYFLVGEWCNESQDPAGCLDYI